MAYTISCSITKLCSSSIHQLTCDMTDKWQNTAPDTEAEFTQCFEFVFCGCYYCAGEKGTY